ncbi:ADP-ribose pyrophosphatase [Lapidilactobacillus concavus DSM 17758]|uniref:ADP-ribose pyrophosphatase n=2 Tax=Lapidilactobacillus TaxID=2767884 RepID=A0A0R1VSV8_9LACO|nr:ADP-ribose pyrophosphatase [Lapidilactobacillus concavus DSM 17758]
MEGELTMSEFTEKVIGDELVYHGHIIDVHHQTVELPNGKPAQRDIVQHHGAVAILTLTADHQQGYFVRQWRAPLQHETWEIPAGKIEATETDPLVVAKRELNEEIGVQAEQWQLLSNFYSSPGFATERMFLYLATDLSPILNKRPLDEDEFLEVKLLTLPEIQARLEATDYVDAKTLLAVKYWEQLIANEDKHENK